MEKEICILKNFRNILDATTDTDCSELDKAIATIEEAMKPKECSKCKHIHQGWWCNENGIRVTLDFGCNRYEPKDTQC